MAARLALRIGVDGSRFHGTQRQRDVPTANGTLLEALDEADLLAEPHRLRAAGRVDAGVHARDHVVAVNVDGPLDHVARTLAGSTVGLVPWAGARVHDRFDPRAAARSRTYRYLVPQPPDVDRLARAWALFEGRHDVSEFAHLDPDRDQDPNRTIARTRSWTTPRGLVLEARAPTFLHHQVRRMVGACCTVARGELALERIEAALAGGKLGTYEVADAEGLILWRVAVSADWTPLDEALRIGRQQLSTARARLDQRAHALDAVADPTRRPRA